MQIYQLNQPGPDATLEEAWTVAARTAAAAARRARAKGKDWKNAAARGYFSVRGGVGPSVVLRNAWGRQADRAAARAQTKALRLGASPLATGIVGAAVRGATYKRREQHFTATHRASGGLLGRLSGA